MGIHRVARLARAFACVACVGAGSAFAGEAADLAALKAKYSRPAAVPHPAHNAPSEARERLGQALFFDPRLSGSGTTACATCHHPGLAWADNLPKGVGHGMKALARRTPTILDTGFAAALFWDGRAESLEEQALGPITAAAEMNMSLDVLLPRLRGMPGYVQLFEAAYPGEGISKDTVAKALATFERTVVSGAAPFDHWLAGDESAISDDAKRGFVLFNGSANCAKCHAGWRFSDDSFHDIGVASDDRGRGALFADIGVLQFAFKTPTLRDVARRAPYLHDGSAATLESVVALYDVGGHVKRPSLAAEIEPLGLSEHESRQLVAFLRTLTSDAASVAIPTLPH